MVAIFKREGCESAPESKGLAQQSYLESNNSEADGSLIGSGSPLVLTKQGELETLPRGEVLMPSQKEADVTPESLSLWQTYRVMLEVLWLRPVLQYIALMFIVKVRLIAYPSHQWEIYRRHTLFRNKKIARIHFSGYFNRKNMTYPPDNLYCEGLQLNLKSATK